MRSFRAIALAMALLLGSAAQAEEEEEEEEDSYWIEILVTGQGFSTFHAMSVNEFRDLGPDAATRLRRFGQSAHYVEGSHFTAEESVSYYYFPRCHRRGAKPVIIKRAVSRSDERLELKCPT